MTSKHDYAKGHLDGILASSWICGDCGNTYDARVDTCPNLLLDPAYLQARRRTSENTSARHTGSRTPNTPSDDPQYGYLTQQRTDDGIRIVVGPFATRREAEKAAGGKPIVDMYTGSGTSNEHRPECACADGTCCSWIPDCTCQCLCGLIIEVEQRVRNERRPGTGRPNP